MTKSNGKSSDNKHNSSKSSKSRPSGVSKKESRRSTTSRRSESPMPECSSRKRPRGSEFYNEAPAKKNRESSEPAEEETKRSRRSTKHKYLPRDPNAPRDCCLCRESQTSLSEPLKRCGSCEGRYHLSKCLRYNSSTATNHFDNNNWRCPRCIRCETCHELIDDPANVECSMCSIAYHGHCRPKGTFLSEQFNSDWICHSCNKEPRRRRETYVLVPHTVSTPPDEIPKSRKARALPEETKLEFDAEEVKELTALLDQRDHVFELLRYDAGLTTVKPTEPAAMSAKNSKSKKKKKKVEGTMMAIDYDKELFEKSRAEAYPPEPSSSAPPTEQWIHFGTGENCKAIYPSAYDEPLCSAPRLFACKFCLHTTHIKEDFITHWKYCNARHPPGNEIYRHENLAFFEVDGEKQRKYCQDLCLISKLFIASKTLYDEVETFIFYVLCEIQREGYVIVGYFSKEKNPSKNNNLSCLLVLPLAQKMGYGSLLIDMSYELSRIEHKVGHPEHPLSDLGILAYRAYWRSSILCYLRSHRNLEKMTIKDICLATRITQVDLINQMMLDNLLVMKNGVTFIKISKRALKYPLSRIRRRAVERSKIIWSPRDTGEVLDPNKINTYV